MSETRTFRLTIHYEDDHMWAEVDDLPGCFASGRDLEELREALAEAIGFYLSDSSSPASVAAVHIDPISAQSRVPATVELVPC